MTPVLQGGFVTGGTVGWVAVGEIEARAVGDEGAAEGLLGGTEQAPATARTSKARKLLGIT